MIINILLLGDYFFPDYINFLKLGLYLTVIYRKIVNIAQ